MNYIWTYEKPLSQSDKNYANLISLFDICSYIYRLLETTSRTGIGTYELLSFIYFLRGRGMTSFKVFVFLVLEWLHSLAHTKCLSKRKPSPNWYFIPNLHSPHWRNKPNTFIQAFLLWLGPKMPKVSQRPNVDFFLTIKLHPPPFFCFFS